MMIATILLSGAVLILCFTSFMQNGRTLWAPGRLRPWRLLLMFQNVSAEGWLCQRQQFPVQYTRQCMMLSTGSWGQERRSSQGSRKPVQLDRPECFFVLLVRRSGLHSGQQRQVCENGADDVKFRVGLETTLQHAPLAEMPCQNVCCRARLSSLRRFFSRLILHTESLV